jgi:hypothetical protein
MTDQTTPAGLFAEPEPTFELPPFPAVLVRDTRPLGDLRYIEIGEDGEYVVVLGHPTREQIEAFVPAVVRALKYDEDLAPDYDDFDFTWAHLLERCPDHEAKQEDCGLCWSVEPDEPWLDWSVAKGEPAHANEGKPGYFPVAVWSVGS